MAYVGFLLTGQGLRNVNSPAIAGGALGALEGFLLAVMFTLRERRRRKATLIEHSIAQILPELGFSPEDRSADPRLKD